MEVVTDPQRLEAGLLREHRLLDQLLRVVFLAAEEVADPHPVPPSIFFRQVCRAAATTARRRTSATVPTAAVVPAAATARSQCPPHRPCSASPAGCGSNTLPSCGSTGSRDRPPARISGPTSRSKTGGSTVKPARLTRFANPTDRRGRWSRSVRTTARATFSGESTGGGGGRARPAGCAGGRGSRGGGPPARARQAGGAG